VSDSLSSLPAVNDVEESEGLPSLDKPGWYSQGNWPHLHELVKTMTGKPEPKVCRPPPCPARTKTGASKHLRLALRLTPTSFWQRLNRMINHLGEIHTRVMERRSVALGTTVD